LKSAPHAYVIESNYIRIFKHPHLEGENEIIRIKPGMCKNLGEVTMWSGTDNDLNWNNKVSSALINQKCAIFYDYEDCTGQSVLMDNMSDFDCADDFRKCNFNYKASSIKLC
jgi:hypothetical protein